MQTHRISSLWRRFDVSVFTGLLIGSIYTAIDLYLDHTIGAVGNESASLLQYFHAFIDLVLPAVTGALFGAVLHLTRSRSKMAALEKERADELAGKIHKIERDQAVWVISASLLHELKTPLHALGLLLDEVAELPQGEADARGKLIQQARNQSERLESRLLALKSLENTSPPQLPELDLKTCIEEITRPLVHLADRRGVQLQFRALPSQAFAHPSYLRIILENLIENALDALTSHCDNGCIVVEVGQDKEGPLIRISDNGPGLNENERANIFEPLFSHKARGLGLGLSIARGLCRSMGGDLLALCPEKGAEFQIRLRGATP